MKFWNLFFIILLSGTMLQAQTLKTQMDSLSYSVGILVAQNLKSQGLDAVDAKELSEGISDVLNGNDLKISQEEANTILRDYMMAAQARLIEVNKEAGIKFLEANARRKEVVTLSSGLQYEILTSGEGPRPNETDEVTVHYHGTLIDGTVFDSSVSRGEPATFPVNGVIQGWIEALQLMPVGSKWKLYIPSELAYGERGAGNDIAPYSTLIFEVELLKIK